jgi:hypothetical protein
VEIFGFQAQREDICQQLTECAYLKVPSGPVGSLTTIDGQSTPAGTELAVLHVGIEDPTLKINKFRFKKV